MFFKNKFPIFSPVYRLGKTSLVILILGVIMIWPFLYLKSIIESALDLDIIKFEGCP